MNENKEQKTNLPAAPVEEEISIDETLADELVPEEAEEEETPVEDKVFGLPRRTFHLVVVGYAVGVILVGLLGLAGVVGENTSTVMPGVICAAFGYLLSKWLDKRDAEKQGTDGAQK